MLRLARGVVSRYLHPAAFPRPRARGAARVQVTIEPPRLLPTGWLLRLRVTNNGAPTTALEGRAALVPGSPATSQGPSWALPWRHHEGAREVNLRHGEAEL